jgi:hypothetical protein
LVTQARCVPGGLRRPVDGTAAGPNRRCNQLGRWAWRYPPVAIHTTLPRALKTAAGANWRQQQATICRPGRGAFERGFDRASARVSPTSPQTGQLGVVRWALIVASRPGRHVGAGGACGTLIAVFNTARSGAFHQVLVFLVGT